MKLLPHASDRLARAVVAVRRAPRDPRTFGLWSRTVGMSESQLRAACRAAKVDGHAALDLSRFIRAATVMPELGGGWEEALDFADDRTLTSFLRRCGTHRRDRVNPMDWLERQSVVNQPLLIQRIRQLIAEEDAEGVA